MHMRSALVLNRLGFGALVAWVAKMAWISTFQAVLLCISTGLRSTLRIPTIPITRSDEPITDSGGFRSPWEIRGP